MNKGVEKKANRLIHEKSPYLLQHAYNPVDWYSWGEEAFLRAKEEDKPVFLSIGYSTCHWCHVMERESFEDEEVAALLNRDFISIKVDREERPDLDQVYMAACQAFTGQGGWPLTVLLTPDQKPFFAGTYFPKHSRYGLYGMVDLLPKVGEIWKNERSKITDAAAEVMSVLHQRMHAAGSRGDARAGSDMQAGGDAQTGDDAQTGGDTHTGDDAHAGGNAQTGDDAQTGGDGQTGDDAQAGGDGQTGDDAQTGGDGQAGGDGQTGDDAQTGGDGQAGGDMQNGSGAQTEDDAPSGSGARTGSDSRTGGAVLSATPFEEAYRKFLTLYDRKNGGFGGAPKFPSPHQLEFLLRYYRRSGAVQALGMALETLKAMHRGGIFDQIGFGMHRYAVDERWLVPHFEKMLYDQATTALAALEAYAVTADEEMALFARRILDYALTGLVSPEGAFYAAEDADSEGEEGTFYVWRPQEIISLLGREKGRVVCAYYGVTEEGNFEKGSSVLHRAWEDQTFAARHDMSVTALENLFTEARAVLFAARDRRERPFRDDKILTAWNGLIIAALARGAAVLREPRYLDAASRAATFILEKMTGEGGRLLRRYRDGEAVIAAFLDDYAALTRGLIELYMAGGEHEHLAAAERLTAEMLALFDAGEGVLKYSAPHDKDGDLVFNPDAEDYDGAIPSGVSLAAMNLIALGRLRDDADLREKGEALIRPRLNRMAEQPTAFSYLLCALDEALHAQAALAGGPVNGDAEGKDNGKANVNSNEGKFYCSPDGSCGLG